RYLAAVRSVPALRTGEVVVLDPETGKEKAVLRDEGFSPRVTDFSSIAFLPGGRLAVPSSRLPLDRWQLPEALRVWDIASARVVQSRDHIWIGSVCRHPGRELLATTTMYIGSIRVYDLSSWREVHIHHGVFGDRLCPAFSPDGKILAIARYSQPDSNDSPR